MDLSEGFFVNDMTSKIFDLQFNLHFKCFFPMLIKQIDAAMHVYDVVCMSLN